MSDTVSKSNKGQYCGTMDFGCHNGGAAIEERSSNMCNGVFAPVCAPEVCNVPRMQHTQDLVIAHGTFINESVDLKLQEAISFKLHIYREMQVYKGELEIEDTQQKTLFNSTILTHYEVNKENEILAVFQIEEHGASHTRALSVYAVPQHHLEPAKFYAYSAPLREHIIALGGIMFIGEIKVFKDQTTHGH